MDCSNLSIEQRSELRKLLFPAWADLPSLSSLEALYPKRSLAPAAIISRVAPSPTGFAHIGLVFAALVNRRLAQQSGGAFILRVEDTDEKREIEGAFEAIVDALKKYHLTPDEGFIIPAPGQYSEIGEYGPYLQSKRKAIYRAHAMHLVEQGLAYPCFCTEQELQEIARTQTERKLRPGYFGRWAKWRDAPLENIKSELAAGKPFVIRLRAFGDYNTRISWNDGLKGAMSVPQNDLDVVILKSDGQSLYHLAHMVDDHYMRITHVIRGDEWLSSVPLHLQLYQAFAWEPPQFAHLSTIQKAEMVTETDEETGETVTRQSKRKLSKRKDPEANVTFYFEQGFPADAVLEYLLNLANSDFEDWRKAHPETPHSEFILKLGKLSSAGAIADVVKLASISKDLISRMETNNVYEQGLEWAKHFDPELATLMERDADYTKASLAIERGGKKPSKRIGTWQDLRPQIGWMYEELFSQIATFPFPENIPVADRRAIAEAFMASYGPADTKDDWFGKIKSVATKLGYAADMKDFKANPAAFKGNVSDVAMVLRVALSGSPMTPDLHEVMRIMGVERVKGRLFSAIEKP